MRPSHVLVALCLASFSAVGCAGGRPGEADALTNVRQLTTGFAKAGEGYFSDDLRWVIFQATPTGESQYQMYVAPVRRSGGAVLGLGVPVRITPPGSRNTCGFFSPDARSLIFASTAGKDEPSAPAPGYQRGSNRYTWEFSPGMEIFRADGWQGAMAVVEGGRGFDFAKHPLTKNDAYDAECAFSPDGEWIVFASNREPDEAGKPDLDLWVMRADGTRPVKLTNTPGYDGGPFFSPDGKRIVYRSDRKGDNLLQIFIADLVFNGSGEIVGITRERQITRDANVNWGPFWHPSGHAIIYASSAQGHQNYELYMVRADGTQTTRITYTDGFDGLPAFSSDGKHLMWSSKRTADGTTQLFVADFRLPESLKQVSWTRK